MAIAMAAWILGGLAIAAHDNGDRHKVVTGIVMAMIATLILLIAHHA